MLKIILSPKAEFSFKKLDKKLSKSILLDFKDHISDVNWFKSHRIKKLVWTSLFRYKKWSYRIIFDNELNIFNIFDIRKRDKNTYKNI